MSERGTSHLYKITPKGVHMLKILTEIADDLSPKPMDLDPDMLTTISAIRNSEKILPQVCKVEKTLGENIKTNVTYI